MTADHSVPNLKGRIHKPAFVITIEAMNRAITAKASWDSWFDGEGATSDFMVEREQPVDPATPEF